MDALKSMELVGDFLIHVPAFPYLWIPHCIMMSWNLRQTYGKDALNLAKGQPLSCFIRALFYTYPGGILAAILASEPPLAFLANTPSILSMIISWYLIFFAPADLFVALLKKARLAFIFSICQDFQRLQLCMQGVQIISKGHPGAFLYMTFFATCKSSGFMVIKYLEHLLDQGLVKPFHIPNYPTKTCVLASMAFAADASGILALGGPPCILTYFSFLVLTLRLFVPNNQTDPYIWLESLPYGLLYGHPEDSSKKSKKVTFYYIMKKKKSIPIPNNFFSFLSGPITKLIMPPPPEKCGVSFEFTVFENHRKSLIQCCELRLHLE